MSPPIRHCTPFDTGCTIRSENSLESLAIVNIVSTHELNRADKVENTVVNILSQALFAVDQTLLHLGDQGRIGR
jgi:hypothetical protein